MLKAVSHECHSARCGAIAVSKSNTISLSRKLLLSYEFPSSDVSVYLLIMKGRVASPSLQPKTATHNEFRYK